MKHFDTLSEATNALQAEGYNLDFNLNDDHLHCVLEGLKLYPDDFQIDAYYRFEGETDPADEAIVYAISSPHLGAKGILIDGFGASAGSASPELIAKLHRK
jgi:hypothetical protein